MREKSKETTKQIYTFLFYKNLAYKNVMAYICSKFKDIVVILLVAIFISFQAFTPDKIKHM